MHEREYAVSVGGSGGGYTTDYIAVRVAVEYGLDKVINLTDFDPVAAREAQRDSITAIILDGNDLPNLRNYLEEKEFKGTIITPD